jgi:hypothetical protein
MPSLSAYYKFTGPTVVDPTLTSKNTFTFRAPDLNGDGKEDLLVLGAFYPGGPTNYTPQAGRVLFGDGNGGFRVATAAEFPIDALTTVHPRKVVYADFNGDGRTDFFIADHGWDAFPFPGAQNRLFLSRKDGGFDDAAAKLPQVNDFSHSVAAGDIDGDGDVDLFVGNGYDSPTHELAYTLLNDGKGNFTQSRANIPTAPGSVLDFRSAQPHHFPGSNLVDLNGDGLPELLITADANASYDGLRQSIILWNKNGSYSESAMTTLPAPAGITSHIDLDIQKMDFNYDGRPDLVLIGTNGSPFYDGNYIQLLQNDGNGGYVDVTAASMAAADARTVIPNTTTGTAWGMWVKTLDFNGDGVLDFAVEYNGALPNQSTPLVWLNDGAGHFTTLKAGDFVAPGDEWRLGGGHFYKTDNGYSFVSTQEYPGSGGLNVIGLVATQAYREHAASPNVTGTAAADQFATTGANNLFDGGAGLDTLVMSAARANYTVTKTQAGIQLKDNSGVDGTDTLVNIERVKFADQALAFDVDGIGGQAYRVYQAAFARTPDAGGLGFWMNAMDHGVSLRDVAIGFVGSNEFKALYGAAPTSREIVSKFYENVLHRPGEAAGIDFWSGVLESKSATVAEVLMGFSESPENQTALVGVMSNGMAYTPFG